MTRLPEGCRMQLERKSLIACTLLFLTGCSAVRQMRQAAGEYDSPDRVPMPIRHGDELDTHRDDYKYEYESAPSRGEESVAPRSSWPPEVPMREPTPAPPAIGVSRVKSVSWLRRFENDPTRNTCGDDRSIDGCTIGSTSPLYPDYFTEGCVTPPLTNMAPSLGNREKTNVVEVIRGWNLRRRTPASKRVHTPQNCGEQTLATPGCSAPGGCAGNGGNMHSFPTPDANRRPAGDSKSQSSSSRNGSLAEPFSENCWEERNTHHEHPGFTPDELMELPSHLRQHPDQMPQRVPQVPDASQIERSPALHVPKPAAADSPVPASVEQQVNPDSVNINARPPMWPRLGPPAPKPASLQVDAPSMHQGSALPLIQPGRRI